MSASTVNPCGLTSANPPLTTTLSAPPSRKSVRMPGRTVVTNGAWSASTPKSPSTPGTSTCSTSPENKSFSGETSSKWKLAIVRLTPALAQSEPHAEPDHTADRGHDRDMPYLAAGERSAARSFVVAHLDA